MGRAVKARASYLNDAAFLVRLSQAVEKDSASSAEWKIESLSHLSALQILLLLQPEAKRRYGRKKGGEKQDEKTDK